MQLDLIRQSLTDLPIPEIRYFDTIGSTNDEALAWAETGTKDGTLVIADQQTKGRGRLGRSWVTNPGAALAFSIILRPTAEEIEHLTLFSPLAGLAVCLTLQSMHLPAEIKWPNDVLLARRKTCGILAESAWQGEELQAVVIGIGINVAPSSVPPDAEVLFPATCVEEHLEEPVDRLKLLRSVLISFFEWRQHIGSAGFIQAWESRLAFKGEMVTLKNSGGQGFSGILSGIDALGNLLMQQEDGSQKLVSVGDVHLRPING
ncbi:MAG TPA: biotin--[acetyl-CoA-carboxylase] ligase [Bellilinea sp.]|nr:biotin--[acetyl-CoA-carboxylase] ligase [Bellilinea sp.]